MINTVYKIAKDYTDGYSAIINSIVTIIFKKFYINIAKDIL